MHNTICEANNGYARQKSYPFTRPLPTRFVGSPQLPPHKTSLSIKARKADARHRKHCEAHEKKKRGRQQFKAQIE